MQNPIRELITDKDYAKIEIFIKDMALRRYIMKREYRKLRSKGMTSMEAYTEIHLSYPLLSFDEVKDIIRKNKL